MGDLKPLGSERLEGSDKLRRIMEIANYGKESLTESNNTSADYTIQLADGNYYGIVKEKVGYIVKKGINESELDYIEPMKNRKYHKSFSQAMKKINLLAGELNRIHENQEGVDLIGEQKKFVLKTPEAEVEAPKEEPTPDETDLDLNLNMGDEEGSDEEMDLDLDLDMDAPEGDEEMGDEEVDIDVEADEEETSFKTIQKLTGKLAQKLRSFDQAMGIKSSDMKYVINSILSALDLENLDEEDREEILEKFEEPEEDIDYGVDDEAKIDVEAGDEDFDLDLDLDMDEEEPETELSEDMEDYFLSIDDELGWYDKKDRKYDGDFDFDYDEEEVDSYDDLMDKGIDQKWFASRRSDDDGSMFNDGRRMFDLYKDKYGKPFKLRKRRRENEESNKIVSAKKNGDASYTVKYSNGTTKKIYVSNDAWDEINDKYGNLGNNNMDSIVDEIFNESKIDKIISKYFVITEEEKKINEEKQVKNFIQSKVKKVSVNKEIQRLSETVEQEMASNSLLKENNDLTFIGKTNMKNLVFQKGNKTYKISPKGELL